MDRDSGVLRLESLNLQKMVWIPPYQEALPSLASNLVKSFETRCLIRSKFRELLCVSLQNAEAILGRTVPKRAEARFGGQAKYFVRILRATQDRSGLAVMAGDQVNR